MLVGPAVEAKTFDVLLGSEADPPEDDQGDGQDSQHRCQQAGECRHGFNSDVPRSRGARRGVNPWGVIAARVPQAGWSLPPAAMTSREELVEAIEEGLEMLLTAAATGDDAEVEHIQNILDQRIDELARFDSLHCSQAA